MGVKAAALARREEAETQRVIAKVAKLEEKQRRKEEQEEREAEARAETERLKKELELEMATARTEREQADAVFQQTEEKATADVNEQEGQVHEVGKNVDERAQLEVKVDGNEEDAED